MSAGEPDKEQLKRENKEMRDLLGSILLDLSIRASFSDDDRDELHMSDSLVRAASGWSKKTKLQGSPKTDLESAIHQLYRVTHGDRFDSKEIDRLLAKYPDFYPH